VQVFLQGAPDRYFNRRIIAVLPLEPDRFGRMQGRLRHESRPRTAVRLCGMDQEGMT